MKREGELKSLLNEQMKLLYPEFLTLFFSNAGAPDRGYVGGGITTYWEFKHATPDFESPGNQALFCSRLAVQSYCRYVIWSEWDEKKTTYIIHPRIILQHREHWREMIEFKFTGFDMERLAVYIGSHHARR